MMRAAGVSAVWLALACYGGESVGAPEQLYGRWKVTAVIDASPVTAMSGAAADRLIGQYLTVASHKVQFNRQACQATLAVSKVSIQQDFKIDAKSLDLPDPATRYDGGCTDIFMRGPGGAIVFTWKGYFLEAVKQPPHVSR
jgi:hypothetical protein